MRQTETEALLVVSGGTEDAGDVRKNVFVEVEAHPHEALNLTLPRSARSQP